MNSEEFLNEILAPVREFCHSLDANPPAYSYIPLRSDEERIRVMQSRLFNELRAADPGARIIILTTFDGDEDIYRAMRAGAKAYLLKGVKREELFRCIREVHAGRFFLPPNVAAKLAGRQCGEELTTREMEVLRLLAAGKPNKVIAMDLGIGEVTVKSHVRAIFTKLNVLSRTEAIAAASRSGLIH